MALRLPLGTKAVLQQQMNSQGSEVYHMPVVVIQCAASKVGDAGFLARSDGRQVTFVADPDNAPPDQEQLYAHPDAPCHGGLTWRDMLLEYNKNWSRQNPLHLKRACELYRPAVYTDLVRRFGVCSVFILSAGWGLVRSDFLLAAYDITFSSSAERFKRRRRRDLFNDFCMLPAHTCGPVAFVGGASYLPMFLKLTAHVNTRKIVFFNGRRPPLPPACAAIRFICRSPGRKTNWHYECAEQLAQDGGQSLLAG